MNLPSAFRSLLYFVATIASLGAHAYPGESIVLDPATGDYIVTYWDEEEPAGLEKGTFIPSTKIDPSVQSKFGVNEKDSILYRYKVRSGSLSRQIIGTIRLVFSESVIGSQDWPTINRAMITEAQLDAVHDANNAALASPFGWNGSVYSKNGYRISWNSSPNPDTGIRPGLTLGGFGFSSQALPGIGVAQMEGDHPPRGWSGEGPTDSSAIWPELRKLEDNDFISRNAAVPTIAVPVPFDAAVLMDHIRAEMLTWSARQLLDAAFADQLDRYMTAAANAYRLNQPKAGKENIEAVRKLLAHEHQNLDHDDEDNEDTAEHKTATRMTIDRLAARVLDFDLRYVLKRMDREREGGGRDGR